MIPISLELSRQSHRSHLKEETKLLRGTLGKLNWVAEITRSGISFHVCEISTKMKTATISGILSVNKVIKFFKNNPGHFKILSIHSRLNSHMELMKNKHKKINVYRKYL